MENQNPFFAFSYMFKDNRYYSKFGIIYLLILGTMCTNFLALVEGNNSLSMLFMVLIIPALVIVIGSQILYNGYLCSCIKALGEQKSNYVLPFFNLKKDAFLGLKCYAGLLLLGLALVTAFMIIFLISVIICGILFFINQVLGIVIGIILGLVFLTSLVVGTFLYYPAALKLFSIKEDPLVFFDFKTIINGIKTNSDIYYKYVGISVLLAILMFVAILITLVPISLLSMVSAQTGNLIMLLFIALFGAYSGTVHMYISAKCIR